jgi:hypothetical protein
LKPEEPWNGWLTLPRGSCPLPSRQRLSARQNRLLGHGPGTSNTKDAEYISAQVVARRFGIKTGTLSKWRSSGRGPKGWLHLSATRVVYPEAAVDEFLRELTANPLKFRPIQSPEGEP